MLLLEFLSFLRPILSFFVSVARKEAQLITVASWRWARSSWRSMASRSEVGSTRMPPGSSQRPLRPKRRITLTSWCLSQDTNIGILHFIQFGLEDTATQLGTLNWSIWCDNHSHLLAQCKCREGCHYKYREWNFFLLCVQTGIKIYFPKEMGIIHSRVM